MNQAAEQITGYSREELEEMTFWQLVHPDSRKSAVGGAPNGGQSGVRYELKILTKENSTRWLDVTLTMFNHDGALASLITAFDITNRKRAEEGFAVAPGTDRSPAYRTTDAWPMFSTPRASVPCVPFVPVLFCSSNWILLP